MYVPLTGSLYAEDGATITKEFVDNAMSEIEKILTSDANKGTHTVSGQWKNDPFEGEPVEDLRQYLFPNGNAEVFFYYLLGCGNKDYFITETYITGDEALCGLKGTLTGGLEGVFDELGMEVHFGISMEAPPPLKED